VHTCGLWKKGRNSMGVVTEFIEQYKRKEKKTGKIVLAG
jgi:hypothetical protein